MTAASKRARELLAKATPGPWHLRGGRMLSRHPDGTGMGGGLHTNHIANFAEPDDASLCAAAPELLRTLAGEVDELEGALESRRNATKVAANTVLIVERERDAALARVKELEVERDERLIDGYMRTRREATERDQLRAEVERLRAELSALKDPVP